MTGFYKTAAEGITCQSRTFINKGALIAVCDIEIKGWHLVLRDCKWFRKDDRQWVSLPSTSFTNREGKTIYRNVVEFTDRDDQQCFQAAAVEAVEMFRDD